MNNNTSNRIIGNCIKVITIKYNINNIPNITPPNPNNIFEILLMNPLDVIGRKNINIIIPENMKSNV